jgi:hypothetical protein
MDKISVIDNTRALIKKKGALVGSLFSVISLSQADWLEAPAQSQPGIEPIAAAAGAAANRWIHAPATETGGIHRFVATTTGRSQRFLHVVG